MIATYFRHIAERRHTTLRYATTAIEEIYSEMRNLANLLHDHAKKQRAVDQVESLITVTERKDNTPLR